MRYKRRIDCRKIGLFLSVIMISFGVFPENYYVDITTKGNQSGTQENPFATIQHAAEIMRPGDVCYISSGFYPEMVRPAFSGSKDKPLTFKALSGHSVVITGADPLGMSEWEPFGNNFFRVKTKLRLDHENQVFLNGKTMVEARWPNVGDDLLLPKLSEMEDGTSADKIVDSNLPNLDWESGKVWVHAPMYWANWTSEVTSFEKGVLNIINHAPYPGPKQHIAAPEAEYFIYGCLAALDSENEWFYDDKENYLYVYRSNGKLPNEPYYIKNRMLAFDLSNRSYITLKNFEVNGATIATNSYSENIIMDGLKIFYPYYSSEANSVYGTQTDKGVLMLGSNCEIKNCEIAYSSGCGVLLDGISNMVFNCYIHDTNYIGTYAANVKLQGKGNIISHCTLSRTGRAVIDYGQMYKSLIQYCDMNQSGMLTRDAGLTYGNIIHGGNSEIRYNWMHDNLDDNWDMGLYFDHGTQNILSHHNVIWGVNHFGLMINHYGYFHQMYNNTFTANVNGFRSTWGNFYDADLYGCRFANNIFSTPCVATAGNYAWSNNIQNYKELEQNKYLPENSICIDAGIHIPSITDNYNGDNPDLGAYESGAPRWKTGHDFRNIPKLDTTRTLTIYRNMLENSAFEHENHLSPWESSGEIEIIRGGKGQTSPDTSETRMGRWSIKLGAGGEITQKVKGLKPNSWYEFSAFLRVSKGELAEIGVKNENGITPMSPSIEGNAPKWHRAVMRFKTREKQTEAELFIQRTSNNGGGVYVDDCGLILANWE